METQNLKFIIDSEATKHLLNNVNQHLEAVDELSDDFLRQNDIIHQEIIKYNQLLKAWPLLIFRIWLVPCTALVFYSGGTALYNAILFMSDSSYPFLSISLKIIAVALIFVHLAGTYAYILMSLALFSKDLSKSNRSLLFLKLFIGFSSVLNGLFIFLAYMQNPLTWKTNKVLLLQVVIALINLWPSIYAKSVLVQREIFCQVSGSENNPT